MNQQRVSPGDIVEIIFRRKWSLLLPFFLCLLTAAVIAVTLPPEYKSTATILIEGQEIPSDLLNAASGIAASRLQEIHQRIMTSSRIIGIIDQFNLYPESRNKRGIDEIVTLFRDSVALQPVSIDIADNRTGRPTTATIAFTLAFSGKEDPEKILAVTDYLAGLFLSENIQVRNERAAGISLFLDNEIKVLKARLSGIEASIAEWKKKHINSLPEVLSTNQKNLDETDREIKTIGLHVRGLKEKEEYLQTQLASLSPYMENEKERKLEELRRYLIELKTRYTDAYPDVINTKAEIKELENNISATPDNPADTDKPNNPAYITLASQLAATRAEIGSATDQLSALNSKRREYLQRIEATPGVEEQYKSLITERDNTQARYDEMMKQYMDAKMAQVIESEDKGESFKLIDPPRLPQKASGPNRFAILAAGLLIGIGLGIGLAGLKESLDRTVWDADKLTELTSIPVLTIVPELTFDEDIAV